MEKEIVYIVGVDVGDTSIKLSYLPVNKQNKQIEDGIEHHRVHYYEDLYHIEVGEGYKFLPSTQLWSLKYDTSLSNYSFAIGGVETYCRCVHCVCSEHIRGYNAYNAIYEKEMHEGYSAANIPQTWVHQEFHFPPQTPMEAIAFPYLENLDKRNPFLVVDYGSDTIRYAVFLKRPGKLELLWFKKIRLGGDTIQEMMLNHYKADKESGYNDLRYNDGASAPLPAEAIDSMLAFNFGAEKIKLFNAAERSISKKFRYVIDETVREFQIDYQFKDFDSIVNTYKVALSRQVASVAEDLHKFFFQTVILSGGGVKMPFVQEIYKSHFREVKLCNDPEYAVSDGVVHFVQATKNLEDIHYYESDSVLPIINGNFRMDSI